MDSFISTLLIVALPPAAVVFLALVWARGWLRTALAGVVFAIPLAILAWLLVPPAHPDDGFARLGFLTLAIIVLGGAVTGAVLGGVVMLIRNVRRKRQPSQS